MAHEVLVSTGGVARRLGVSPSTVRNYERDGRIPEAMTLEGSGRKAWRESDLADVLSRPTPIRPVRDEGQPIEAA